MEPSRGQAAIAVERACRAIGLDSADILSDRPVGGGCINQGTAVRTTRGDFFLKWNPRADHRFFAVEAEGLAALGVSDAVRVPSVIAASGPGDEVAWLLLEWIEEGRPGRAGWMRLGRELAALHRDVGPGTAGASFGWSGDNLIGSLPQPNGWSGDWAGFWAERRIRPLARELRARGALSAAQAAIVEAVAERAAELLGRAVAADGPSLLHGDLWSGNVLFARGGEPVLIDPAVYVGHREVDLAMADLFGGLPGHSARPTRMPGLSSPATRGGGRPISSTRCWCMHGFSGAATRRPRWPRPGRRWGDSARAAEIALFPHWECPSAQASEP